jgi:ribosomal protein L7/L12
MWPVINLFEVVISQYRDIARDSPTVEEALVALHEIGASPVYAIKALHDGRGLSVDEAKSALFASPAWATESRAAENLHEQIISAIADDDH